MSARGKKSELLKRRQDPAKFAEVVKANEKVKREPLPDHGDWAEASATSKKPKTSRAAKRRLEVAQNTSALYRGVGWLSPDDARAIAKDLRALAATFDENGPNHAAVLRHFASRLAP